MIHGDTHRYRIDHPLVDPATQKPIERFTRIESFGSPFVDWIKVGVDPADPQLLAIKTGTEIKPARWRTERRNCSRLIAIALGVPSTFRQLINL